jgi:hypothetical protein
MPVITSVPVQWAFCLKCKFRSTHKRALSPGPVEWVMKLLEIQKEMQVQVQTADSEVGFKPVTSGLLLVRVTGSSLT